jgi:hypothetical protein
MSASFQASFKASSNDTMQNFGLGCISNDGCRFDNYVHLVYGNMNQLGRGWSKFEVEEVGEVQWFFNHKSNDKCTPFECLLNNNMIVDENFKNIFNLAIGAIRAKLFFQLFS